MKRNKAKKKGFGWIIALIIAVLIVGFAGWMAVNASVLHLMRATVYMPDLPPAFEGKTILYASDIDLGGINTPKRAADAINRLQALEPDILLLGGDYTAPTLIDLLNQYDATRYAANTGDWRGDFFHYICDFSAPLGKYMIASPEDRLTGDVRAQAVDAGFRLLDSDRAEIALGGDRLWLVGLGDDISGVSKLAGQFKSTDAVVAVTSSPNQFPALMTTEAADSGHWVDLALAGHTHGGQIRLFGRSMLTMDTLEQQFFYGWNRETGVPMLVTSGMGCEGVNLRLNTQAEVWLITLTARPTA